MADRSEENLPPSPGTFVEHEKAAEKPEKLQEFCKDEDKRRNDSDAHSYTSTVVDHEPSSREPDIERIQSVKEPLVKVPRAKRRGLFARFAVIAEVTEPTHYTNKTKWLITIIVAIAAAAAPVGSAIILPTLDKVADEFHANPTITNLSVALYMLSMAIWPLWWSSFSETSGRRTVYLISFAMFTVFGVLSAVSRNIAMLVVMRMFNGGAAASVQAVGAGTIADLWLPFERGKAMGYFYLGPLCGPLVAPILGGVLGQTLGWRSTQWALGVYGIFVWLMIFFALPETLTARKDVVAAAAAAAEAAGETSRPPLTRSSTRESVQKKSKQYAKIFRMLFLDPLMVLGYLRFPLVLLCVYYSAVTFGSLVSDATAPHRGQWNADGSKVFTEHFDSIYLREITLLIFDIDRGSPLHTELHWVHPRRRFWWTLDG